MKFLRKYRGRILPVVEDFSKDMDCFKKRDVSSLSFNSWFWLHPSAYRLMSFGTPIIGFCLYVVFGLFAWFNISFKLIAMVLFVLAFSSLRDLVRKFRFRLAFVDTSFYDVYLRDYDGEEVD